MPNWRQRVRLFAPLSMRYSWAFVLRVRPGVARDPHVRQLAAYLLAEAGQNAKRCRPVRAVTKARPFSN
jgi:hypothetical protein